MVNARQGSRTKRFDDHLKGVEEELALMSEEINDLQKQNGELNAMVDRQANELTHIRQENVCLLCRREILGAESPNRAIATSKPRRSTIASPTLPLRSRPSITVAQSRNGTGLHSTSSKRVSQSDVLADAAPPRFKKSPVQPQVKPGYSARPARYSSTTATPPTVLSNSSSLKRSPRSPYATGPVRSQTRSQYSPSEVTNDGMPPNSSPINSIPSNTNVPESGLGYDQPWSVEFSNEAGRSLNVEMALSLNQEKPVWCVKFSPDGKHLATGCRNGKAQIYDMKTGLMTCALVDLTANFWGINTICFSPDGRFLATGADDRLIRIWNIADKRIRNTFKGHTRIVTSLAFSPNGRLVTSASADNSVRVWNMRDGVSRVFHDAGSFGAANCVSVSPNGIHVASAHEDRIVRIWDMRAGQLVGRLEGHTDWVRSVAFMPDGRGLVSGSEDNTSKYWDVSILSTLGPGEKAPLNFEREVEDHDGLIRHTRLGIRRERSGPLKLEFLGHKDYVRSVATSPDGLWVASGSDDHSIRIWHTDKAVVECELKGHKRFVCSVDFNPEGGYLASGDSGGKVRIWKYY